MTTATATPNNPQTNTVTGTVDAISLATEMLNGLLLVAIQAASESADTHVETLIRAALRYVHDVNTIVGNLQSTTKQTGGAA